MRSLNKALAVAAAACAMAVIPMAHADNDKMDVDKFVTMCDGDKDGMVSKAEMMKMVEKMFDKADTKKSGKLDKKQAEIFLKQLMAGGG
jgi:Ca2+-binding EF-hand superfamily protein